MNLSVDNWGLVALGCGVTLFATTLGALGALFTRKLSARANHILLGFSAGVMLSASSFSLINPALELAPEQAGSKLAGALITGVMILLGVAFLLLCDRYIPHEHFETGPEGGAGDARFKRIWLFVFAIALHNFPEGLAVGSGVGSQTLHVAVPILAGIGMQDVPEGFVVAISLMSIGYSWSRSLFVSILTGVLEALAAALGFFATALVTALLPWTLAFAGGAMVYVVIDEMIPEMRDKSSLRDGTYGFMLGFVMMMVLDVAFAPPA